MKVWLQNFNYFPNELGGSEKSSRELANGLSREGFDVKIIISDGSKPYLNTVDGIPVEATEGVRVGRSPLWGKRNFISRALWSFRSELDPLLFIRLYKKLRRDQPALVIMNNPSGHGSAMLFSCRLLGIKTMAIIRDYSWFCAYGTMYKDKRNCQGLCKECRAFSILRRSSLSKTNSIVAISHHVSQKCKSLLKVDADVIYNSVSNNFYDKPNVSKPDSGIIKFGYLGRLHPSKGVSELIDGWLKAKAFLDGHTLSLAGGDCGLVFPEEINSANVEFVGQTDAISFLDSIDVLFVPSAWEEPFGRTVIEGLARGVYVIASANGGLPEIVKHGRGEILTSLTAESIAASIEKYVLNFNGSKSPCAPTNQLSDFRSEIMISKYIKKIRQITSRP